MLSCFLFFFGLGGLPARAQFFLLPCGAALVALCACDNVDNYPPVVFATLRTRAVGHAKRATLTLRKALSCDGVVATPPGGLGAIPAHSYYHSRRIIQCLSQLATVCKRSSDALYRGPTPRWRCDEIRYRTLYEPQNHTKGIAGQAFASAYRASPWPRWKQVRLQAPNYLHG